MPDFLNQQAPLFFSNFVFTANTFIQSGLIQLQEFSEGVNIYWNSTEYTDGDYTIEALGATQNNLIVSKFDENFPGGARDPFFINSNSESHWFGIINWPDTDIRLKITSQNVTSGATLTVVIIGWTQNSPVLFNHIG